MLTPVNIEQVVVVVVVVVVVFSFAYCLDHNFYKYYIHEIYFSNYCLPQCSPMVSVCCDKSAEFWSLLVAVRLVCFS